MEAAVLQARDLLERHAPEYGKFWEFMNQYLIGTLPYSGYVLAASIAFAQKQGIQWPKAKNGMFTEAQQKQFGIVCCGNSADHQNLANGLAELQASDAELRQYFGEL
jgi:hypothetical protein